MSESRETTGQLTLSFTNWEPYKNLILPQEIRYTPPKEREDLRRKLQGLTGVIGEDEKLFLEIALKFLEKGIMEDDFGKEHNRREDFYRANKVKIDSKEVTLLDLSIEVNKLKSNAITAIVTIAQMIPKDLSISNNARNLLERVKKIMEERGYFTKEDLKGVDNLALKIIRYIAKNHGVEISEGV